MRFRAIVTLVSLFIFTVFMACLSVAISSGAISSRPPSPSNEANERGSVSGTISAIGDASFSVETQNTQNPMTLHFLIDDNTKVDGKLEVGAAATVDYRTDAGNNIALRVVVRQTEKP